MCNLADLLPFGSKWRCPVCFYIRPCCEDGRALEGRHRVMSLYTDMQVEILVKEIEAIFRRDAALAWELLNYADVSELERENSDPPREPPLQPTREELLKEFNAPVPYHYHPPRHLRGGFWSAEEPKADE